jgi:hypothetical protein
MRSTTISLLNPRPRSLGALTGKLPVDRLRILLLSLLILPRLCTRSLTPPSVHPRRYQLEAFCNKIRGNKPHHWVTPEDSIQQMETIDSIYEKSGLGKRLPTAEVV